MPTTRSNIFVIGKTNVGKTPLVEYLKTIDGVAAVSASDWVKSIYVRNPDHSKTEYVNDITRFSKEKLKDDHDCAFRHTNSLLKELNIIDGVRNPNDFIKLFDPNRDVVVFVDPISPSKYSTLFDDGVDIIVSYVYWMIQNGLFDGDRFFQIEYVNRIDKEFNIDRIKETICRIITM